MVAVLLGFSSVLRYRETFQNYVITFSINFMLEKYYLACCELLD